MTACAICGALHAHLLQDDYGRRADLDSGADIVRVAHNTILLIEEAAELLEPAALASASQTDWFARRNAWLAQVRGVTLRHPDGHTTIFGVDNKP